MPPAPEGPSGPGAAYRALERRFRRLSLIGEALRLLEWDRAVMMPRGGAATRVEQITELGLVRHGMFTDSALAALLDEAEARRCGLDRWQRANLAAMRRKWRHATAVPADLYEAALRAELACELAWREARPANDFARLSPLLAEVVRLVRETALAKAEALGCAPYDALLDRFDPGLRAAVIEPLFDELAAFLPGFIDEVGRRQAQRPPVVLEGRFPVERQRRLAEELMRALGFPFDHGRLDVSHHPFSGGTPEDLRITTRYDEADYTPALMAVLHETGHALYEFDLPRAWRHQPVGEAAGMSMHESQSLIVEMQVCRSRPFIEFAAPLMRAAFDAEGPAWSADNLYRLATRVERGLIRVDADEVTYPAHIVLRTRIERALIAGELAVADLPGAWAEASRALLGIAPPDDRDGCLQDIHWMEGAFGYFPTYSLGAIIAAQLFDAACRAEPEIEPGIARGDFAPLLAWLRENVHEHASSLSADELLVRATGRTLDAGAFEAHLRARYLD
jgi:carboxypeptidase Taq